MLAQELVRAAFADHVPLSFHSLLPFGAGRRVCVGEKFARHRMFIMITSLIQRLNFRSDPTQELPDPDPRGYKLGFVLHPPNYKVIVENRAEKHCQDILNIL